MYVRSYNDGRSERDRRVERAGKTIKERKSKRRRLLIISICIFALGISDVTMRATAGQTYGWQEDTKREEMESVTEALAVGIQEITVIEVESTLFTEKIESTAALEDRMTFTDAEFQERIVEGIASEINLLSHSKTMYLTFDDGPSPENTEKILDILKQKNIKATFFVIGENVRKNPELARRIVEEGHTIGIHCDWHDYDVLYQSVDSYVADFEKAYQTVYEITGVEATLFRFPGGSINAYNKKVYQEIIKEMTSRGFVYYDWNASLEDAVSKEVSPQTLIQNAKESALGRQKVILLAHDTVDNTVLCLEELIEQFPEYRMEPLTEEVEPIQF